MNENHACHICEPKWLIDYRVPKIINKSTLLLVTPNGKEHKTNINHVKPATTLKLIEEVWDSFLNSIKMNCQNHDYNLRLCS